MCVKRFFEPRAGEKARVVLFLSGTGSNALKVLEAAQDADAPFVVAALATDNPECRALELGERFNVPVIVEDIKKFYADNGETTTRLDSPRRRELRDLWSDRLWAEVEKFSPDIGVLAGFVPLSNIVSHLPCLNVHPGDLTVEVDGKRILAGLHCVPVETAVLMGFKALRSSVILAQAYQDSGEKEMDSGPVLGVSPEVDVLLDGMSVAELNRIKDARENGKANGDLLRQLANKNIDNLKVYGDHVVLPEVLRFFAMGRYGMNSKGVLCFQEDSGRWSKVQTVEFFGDGCYNVHKTNGFSFKGFCRKLYHDIVLAPGTPDFIARGWSLGVIVGCIIPVFCQLVVAVPLSFIFRCSKIGAMGGTFVTTPPTAVFIYPVQCYIGALLLGNKLSMAEVSSAISGMVEKQDFNSFIQMSGKLIAAFFAGGALFAAILAPLTYILVKAMVVKYRKLRGLDIVSGKREAVGGAAK